MLNPNQFPVLGQDKNGNTVLFEGGYPWGEKILLSGTLLSGPAGKTGFHSNNWDAVDFNFVSGYLTIYADEKKFGIGLNPPLPQDE